MGTVANIAQLPVILQLEALMLPNPLHPSVVHFPLVFGVLLPIVAAVAYWLTRRAPSGRGPWITMAVLSLALVVSAWAALQTGRAQEETVESVVAGATIHDHEELAEGFLLGSGLTALIVLIGLAPGRVGRGARALAVVASFAVPVLAIRVGDSGGKLVYEHGAASAYVQTGPGAASGPTETDHGDRREAGEEREAGEQEHHGP
jgi:uncharacterized membrane protein